jgi:hypothetical protein
LGDHIREDEMGETCSKMGKMRNSCKILVVKPEGRDHLGVIGKNERVI